MPKHICNKLYIHVKKHGCNLQVSLFGEQQRQYDVGPVDRLVQSTASRTSDNKTGNAQSISLRTGNEQGN